MSTELHETIFPVVIDNKGVGKVTFTSRYDAQYGWMEEGVWESGDKTSYSFAHFMKKVKESPEDYVIVSVGGHQFPITFLTHHVGLITFYSLHVGKWHEFDSPTNEITTYPIAYFFGQGYEIVGGPSDGVVKVIVEDTDPNYKECAVEDMPLGVKLMGFKDGDTFVELVMTPNVVEVGMECINLLMRRDHPLDIVAEVNFKRGQIIRYTK